MQGTTEYVPRSPLFLPFSDLIAVELPMLRTKPSYEKLRRALESLELPRTTWNGDLTQSSTSDTKFALQYLLSIISSDLAWLEIANAKSKAVADQREELWEIASRRLAERCGRSGETACCFYAI